MKTSSTIINSRISDKFSDLRILGVLQVNLFKKIKNNKFHVLIIAIFATLIKTDRK